MVCPTPWETIRKKDRNHRAKIQRSHLLRTAAIKNLWILAELGFHQRDVQPAAAKIREERKKKKKKETTAKI